METYWELWESYSTLCWILWISTSQEVNKFIAEIISGTNWKKEIYSLILQCAENFDITKDFSISKIIDNFLSSTKGRKNYTSEEIKFIDDKAENLRKHLISLVLIEYNLDILSLKKLWICEKISDIKNIEKIFDTNALVFTLKNNDKNWLVAKKYMQVNPETGEKVKKYYFDATQ